MSFDYLNDIYGRERERKTRFTDLETKAKELIASFVNGTLSDKEFARAFNEIRIMFHELSQTNGEMTIDQDTPLWLNMLLGNHFIDWIRYQNLKWYFEEHPEEFTEERKKRFAQIQAIGYDKKFKDACKKVLKIC
jgi:hypothetical protein